VHIYALLRVRVPNVYLGHEIVSIGEEDLFGEPN